MYERGARALVVFNQLHGASLQGNTWVCVLPDSPWGQDPCSLLSPEVLVDSIMLLPPWPATQREKSV